MKILIVDTDQKSSSALQQMLESRQNQARVIASGSEAWRALEAEAYPIVIVGNLPGIDGLDLCHKIREHQAAAYTCIIMVTDKKAIETRTKSLAAGADIFLSKPIGEDELVARLQIAERILAMEQGPTAKKRAA